MAYDTDTRKIVIEYLNNGHTEEEAKKEFGVSVPSMTKWRKLLRETGSLLDDISIEELRDDGLSHEQFFPEADALAEFIYKVKNEGYKFICQCEFGQSRSGGSAAAILQHFEQSGIKVFANYKYYPNKLIYHKLFEALERYKAKTE